MGVVDQVSEPEAVAREETSLGPDQGDRAAGGFDSLRPGSRSPRIPSEEAQVDEAVQVSETKEEAREASLRRIDEKLGIRAPSAHTAR
jgi:hypothetical protein